MIESHVGGNISDPEVKRPINSEAGEVGKEDCDSEEELKC